MRSIFAQTLCLASLCVACAASPPRARTPAPADTDAAVAASPPDAATDAPVAPAAPRFGGARVLFEAPWPGATTPGLVAAVITGLQHTEEGVQAITVGAPGLSSPMFPITLDGGARARGLSLLDATGDGAVDAVVWLDQSTRAPNAAPQSVMVFTLRPAQPDLLPAPWTSQALGAVADEAALRAAVPALRRFVMPEEAADLDAVLLRVGFATNAQFRALLAPGGVTVCTARERNARPHSRRCNRLAPAALTEARLDELRRSIQLTGGTDNPDETAIVDDTRRCNVTATMAGCDVPTGGPASTTVTFSNTAPARRIVRIEYVAYEDS